MVNMLWKCSQSNECQESLKQQEQQQQLFFDLKINKMEKENVLILDLSALAEHGGDP